MFTGIVEATGVVAACRGDRLALRAGAAFARLKTGASLAVNGACLTVAAKKDRTLFFDLLAETRRRTALGVLRTGDRVNLERPLRYGARIEGHFVTGHVDGRGKVARVLTRGRHKSAFIVFPGALRRYFFEKGSVALDGVSLTLGRVEHGGFWVHWIPHTLRGTALGNYRAGRPVNLEADILAKLAWRIGSGTR